MPCSAAFRSAWAWLRSDSACSRSRSRNGMVLIQVLRAGVDLSAPAGTNPRPSNRHRATARNRGCSPRASAGQLFTCSPGTTRIRLTGPPTCVITGVVLKALYATAPVSRSVCFNVAGSTVTTCTCVIWSSGMVKSCGVAEARRLREGRHLARHARCRSSDRPESTSTDTRRQARFRICSQAIDRLNLHGKLLVPTASRSCSSASRYDASAWR